MLSVSSYPNKGILDIFLQTYSIGLPTLFLWHIAWGLYLTYYGEQAKLLYLIFASLPYLVLNTANLILAIDEHKASIFGFMQFYFVFAFFFKRFYLRIVGDGVQTYLKAIRSDSVSEQ